MPTFDYKNAQGKPVLGTTTIINSYLSKEKAGALQGWAYKTGKAGLPMRQKVEEAADIGTAVHAACAFILRGNPDYEEPLKVLKPDLLDKALNSVLGFLSWQQAYNVTIDHIEEPLVSEVHAYGGCPDYVGFVSSTRSLLDLKSGNAIYDEYWIQVRAYGELWNEHHPHDPIRGYHILNVKKDDGGFTHAYKPELSYLFEKFLLLKQLVELDRKIGG